MWKELWKPSEAQGIDGQIKKGAGSVFPKGCSGMSSMGLRGLDHPPATTYTCSLNSPSSVTWTTILLVNSFYELAYTLDNTKTLLQMFYCT